MALTFLLDAGDVQNSLGVVLRVVFMLLCFGIITFVLFRHTDTSGLGGAFGAGNLSGEGAFGAKSHKVADRVIAWMCGLFLALALLIAHVTSRHAELDSGADQNANSTAEKTK
jgi:protein translocase SecG subunit